ncbi:hypothetical protein L2E82_18407 [Cichorium intybus]|uniref:Uncharacterized protein n=1 Tax=Cichorium intybus TaxID=13427 RepID=A0ACB9F9E0_CICIN|nr:hypothetical protein L2E82_18407 [Cichorium intybus]
MEEVPLISSMRAASHNSLSHDDQTKKTVLIEFVVIRTPSEHNILLERPGLLKFGAVASTVHGTLKFHGDRQRMQTTKVLPDTPTGRTHSQGSYGKFPTWIANPVMVKKSDGSWRMCIDYKDLNKACPKDSYPLPKIDQKIESLHGFRWKCFLDAYKGYHPILMKKDDEEKTAFYTDHRTFCYQNMPFGLKNTGATYQRLVDRVFAFQIGRNIEVNIDDMVIKSRTQPKKSKSPSRNADPSHPERHAGPERKTESAGKIRGKVGRKSSPIVQYLER